MDTHCNIHARACGCAYEAGKGKRNGKRMGKEADYGSGKKHQDLF